ncbi:UDP-glucuronosyltransferase 2C1-like [Melanaphis sacchari]|uniref:UDP-glucuronosyltransferase 2C1 n=1 Tax=Melanaphis sacchari TaxID=742174 RepID=A0A2H8TJ71_9HEMI|nr:UDP-glucuronosyltransferase 2C1-like [Melanaphis sacchari]XP_025193840.1 UDP-glucuronosyltransferase 2C1-like [Melanaphis sacchari]XP_025193841.1 UDP-glucuronosyltransferase 2C1-like [Melanaphis sacchari]
MENYNFIKWIFKLLFLITATQSANILVFAPMPFKSHFRGFQPLFKELANRGHNLTVVSTFPLKTPLQNYTDIPISVDKSILKSINPMELASHGFLTVVPSMWYMSTNLGQKMVSKPEMQNFILSQDYEFNLVMVFPFCQEYTVTLGHKYKAPVINLGVSMLWPSNSKWIGEPSTFSYILDQRTRATDQMTFIERFKNTIIGIYQLFLEDYYYLPLQKETMNKYFKYKGYESRPPIEDMLRNVSVTLINSHYSIGVTRPYLPSTIEIAGLHVNNPKPLTGKFLEFVESAEYGVIYFSFGTIVDPSTLPNSTIEIFINVLKKVKQKVMWKWDSKNLPQLPSHIMISNWFPQSDILGHPNVRLFITHGGVHSLEEATYNALPIVGIPFFGDQHMNMRLAERNGIGKMVDHIDLNEESMLSAINEVLTNPKYKENSKLRSEIFKDTHPKPMDRAIYWIEYVLRHGGANHLRSSSVVLNYNQYFLGDIFFLIIGMAAVNIFLITIMIKYILKIKNINFFKKNK